MAMRLARVGDLLLVMTLIVPLPALAQTSMGAVNGTVSDASGSALPGATVTLVNQATNVRSVQVTNDSGHFTFVNVRPGTYLLTVERDGFSRTEVSAFTIGVNETLSHQLMLEIGQLTETTTVTARSELLQASTAELGNVVEEKVIRQLPTQGRNFTQLLLLSPGVNPVSTAQGPGANGSGELTFGTEGNSGLPGSSIVNASVQGQQNRSKIYYLDGIVNTSVRAGTYVALPDLDALQEFKVQSHSDKAEFGGVTGGVVNMTSKSGTNQFRGSGFGFFRDEGFAARNPFRDALRDDHPVFRQSQFGANVGGPVFKDKTFFFAAYDGWHYRDVAATRHTVPAAAELDGDFSQAFHGRTIYNPYSTRIENGSLVRDPFPGNVIPPELISPSMQAFLKAYMVRPNVPGSIPDNFLTERDRESKAHSFQVRIDHHFDGSDNLFFRWNDRRIDNFQPIGDRGFNSPEATNRNIGGGWFHAFTSSLVMEVRGGYTNQITQDAPLQHELGVAPQQGLGLPELDRYGGYIATDLAPWSLPNLGVQGERPRENPNWNAAADVTWLRGRHNVKAGFQMLQISRLQENQFGQLRFSAEATRDPQNPSRTGDALAAALLGMPSRIQAFVPEFGSIDFKTSTLSGYIQDQWAIRPNLTLTYGLRYDYITRATGRGLQSGPDLSTGEWLIALPQLPPVCTGQAPPCLPTPIEEIPFNQFIRATGEEFSILKPIADNWGPRAGVAWQINPRTVFRGGYSLMWDSMVGRSQYGQHQFETWGWPQFSGIDTGEFNREGEPILTVENIDSLPFGLPAAQPWNASGWFNDPDRKNAYSHQWHVEIQREMTRDLMVSVGYVGSYNGRMEYSGYAHVPPVPGIDPATGRRLTPAERDQLRPWPHITGSFRYEDDIGMARYNALHFKAQHRFSGGLASMLSYTWSKSVDTSSGWFAAENGIGGGAHVQNYYDIDSARAVSGYDIPHLLTWGTVWELPAGRGKRWLNSGPAAWLLGDWQLNWMLVARSGQPYTLTVGGDPANIGVSGYARPHLVGDPELDDPNADRWFNVAAFEIPVNAFGNSGRNILRAPGFWNVDLGLQRNVPIGNGSRRLEIRLEAFNVFNHINLGNPDVRIDQPTAGRITSMSGIPRQLQLGFRLLF
jgi:Carboxypeptidase regulatory-like domain/TonB dependent receptor